MADAFRAIAVATPFSVGTVNCYLAPGEPITLIDTGPNHPDSLTSLEAGLAEVGLRVEELEAIVLTHQHYDHVGLAKSLQERSGATVIAHELLADFVERFDESFVEDDAYAVEVMLLHGVDRRTAENLRSRSASMHGYGTAVQVNRRLSDGETIALGALDCSVRLRPGHSPTDTLFVAERDKSALVGDHLIAHISSNPVAHRPLHSAGDPRERPAALAIYLRSLELTAALEITTALPGHGEPIADHRALIRRRIEGHMRRKEHIFEVLGGDSGTAFALVGKVWPTLPVEQVYLALSEILGHLDLLVEERRVDARERDGVISFSRVR
jgi:glyoxylase-like metal-dependent hydrolase (beta-lactamase superfamily II)